MIIESRWKFPLYVCVCVWILSAVIDSIGAYTSRVTRSWISRSPHNDSKYDIVRTIQVFGKYTIFRVAHSNTPEYSYYYYNNYGNLTAQARVYLSISGPPGKRNINDLYVLKLYIAYYYYLALLYIPTTGDHYFSTV